MARRADPVKIRSHFTTTRESDSATYRVFYGRSRSEWTIVRNDNELEAGGNPEIAWALRHNERGVLHECGRKRDALDDLALRYANHKPLFQED